jgi:hypothetical protein
MLGEVFLGGRFNDVWDKRILKTLLERTMTEGIFGHEPYEVVPGCRMPEENHHAAFKDAIEEMPLTDTSALLWLSSNAEHVHRLEVCQEVISQLSVLSPSGTTATGESEMEEVVTEIATNMLAKIPSPWSPEQLKPGKGKQAKTAMHAYMLQEIERMQEVLRTVRSTLQNLLLSMSGSMPISDKMRQMLLSLFDALVPDSWMACSWNVVSLGEWIAILMQRHEQLSKWLSGRPKTFWASGLFNPAGLFMALKQDVVRKGPDIGIEQLALAVVLGEVKEAKTESKRRQSTVPDDRRHHDERRQSNASDPNDSEDSVVLTGVCLDGAAWSAKEGRLVEAVSKGLMAYHDIPKVTVTVYRDVSDEEANKEGKLGGKDAKPNKLPPGVVKDTHGASSLEPSPLHARALSSPLPSDCTCFVDPQRVPRLSSSSRALLVSLAFSQI